MATATLTPRARDELIRTARRELQAAHDYLERLADRERTVPGLWATSEHDRAVTAAQARHAAARRRLVELGAWDGEE